GSVVRGDRPFRAWEFPERWSVQVPSSLEGETAPRPRRCYTFPRGGSKQTAPGSAAAGRPRIPDPNQTANTSSQPPRPDGKQRTGAFGINSILYQRGIYPPETFTRVTHYDLSLLLTTDPKLKSYLTNVVSQLKEWLFECTVQKLVLVITCLETNEVLERWQFDIECDKSAKESSAPREKSIKTIQHEIRSVIRQITATVTFLPLLETPCAFDLLVYTDKDLVVPDKWEESGPQTIDQPEEVRLHSFTTSIHKVNSMVAYKKTESA
uniref:Mitotic spindle assembly checkpoint protein MAD2A n=1 Tax=Astatotilapia calliptera TaxID=8154 RepID=A0A3P8NUC3_ASTCA